MPESQSTLDGGSYYEEIEAHPGTTRTFLKALADTGSVTTAVAAAGTSRTRVYELRKVDPAFAAAWAEAEDIAADRLADEARRRAMEGVPIPVVSAGKLVRDDNGQYIKALHAQSAAQTTGDAISTDDLNKARQRNLDLIEQVPRCAARASGEIAHRSRSITSMATGCWLRPAPSKSRQNLSTVRWITLLRTSERWDRFRVKSDLSLTLPKI